MDCNISLHVCMCRPTIIQSLDSIPALVILGLGCGLPIVTSSSFLPYPKLLTWPHISYKICLVEEALRASPQFDGVAISNEERLVICNDFLTRKSLQVAHWLSVRWFIYNNIFLYKTLWLVRAVLTTNAMNSIPVEIMIFSAEVFRIKTKTIMT